MPPLSSPLPFILESVCPLSVYARPPRSLLLLRVLAPALMHAVLLLLLLRRRQEFANPLKQLRFDVICHRNSAQSDCVRVRMRLGKALRQ
eukprot:1916211-Rhodomonas_salina.1